ncbi:hypothetical protein EVAR_29359_1 [Eumeta japonica]|uniref:Uncharacterized protein n=1 Tax=Eumeta variegata TaxID=151549 RepID=A0A4C1WIA2_EUMVA|nr:hypothetical protein EVAR_29359_1 [Eumeta japonica]
MFYVVFWICIDSRLVPYRRQFGFSPCGDYSITQESTSGYYTKRIHSIRRFVSLALNCYAVREARQRDSYSLCHREHYRSRNRPQLRRFVIGPAVYEWTHRPSGFRLTVGIVRLSSWSLILLWPF